MASFVRMTPQVFCTLQQIVTQLCSTFQVAEEETSAMGRPRKIPPVHALTFALYQHASTRATKKSVYDDFKTMLQCSYKTFVVSVNKAAKLALRLLYLFMHLNRMGAHPVKYTDATDIPVCLRKNADKHQTMKGLAGFGRSSKGFYFGLKMTMTRDYEGRLLSLVFSSPSANDRELFRHVNKDLQGAFFADAGYVSKKLEQEMHVEGKRWVFIRPYKTMKKLATDWQAFFYRGRFQIEFDFRDLKLFHGLVTSLPRSVDGYVANYLFALLSFVLV